jgi:type IV secretory pathway ATPase VirB11/archaellum biosynthesis ATPase
MKKGMNSSRVYNELFKPKISPLFIKTNVERNKPKGFKIQKEYKIGLSKVRVLRKNDQFFYHLMPSELECDYDKIKRITDTLKDIEKMELDLNDFRKEVINKINKKTVEEEERNIIKRHSIGFGILDIIFNDDQVQDVYLYSSGGQVHINHEVFGDCETNITVSKKDIKSIATKIRVASGRPFDETFPVIDYELEEYNLRICGVREPLTFEGVGYAFRKHKRTPWNLSDFIENKMISAEVAGLLNFLVDGQCSMLITGPRGSGKTSLLAALLNEIPISQRVIVIEDTPELPVNSLSSEGFKIQHLRIKPPLKSRSTGYELSAEEALRSALRLGESVLIIGEVRGEEAKVLFEAMRVGATGNVVLGTIHGSSAFDTYDRVVNDLKVPPTSFKATDLILSCANLRRGESLLSDKRLIGITEVKKQWLENPLKEGGFNDLTVFDRKMKVLKLSPKIRDSSIIKKVSELKGITVSKCLRSIKLRAKAKELLVKAEVPRNPRLIAEYNNKITELINKNSDKMISGLKQYLKQCR